VKPGTLGADRREQAQVLSSSKARGDVLGYVQAMRDGAEVHYNPAVFE
jgi:hypothetical protein